MAVPRGPSGDRPNPGRRRLLTCPREGQHDQLPSRPVTTPSLPPHGPPLRPDPRSPDRPRPLSRRRPARCDQRSSHPVRRARSRGHPTRGPPGPTHAAGSGHARRCGRAPLDAINSPHVTAPHLAGWSSLPAPGIAPAHPSIRRSVWPARSACRQADSPLTALRQCPAGGAVRVVWPGALAQRR